MLGDLLSN